MDVLGLFISMNGFSPGAPEALTRGKPLSILLMTGDDLRRVVDGEIRLDPILREKRAAAAYRAQIL